MTEKLREGLEVLERQARSSGDTLRAERLRDDIERLKRIRVGVDVKYQHTVQLKPRARD